MRALNTGYDSETTAMILVGRFDGNNMDGKGEASSQAATTVGCCQPNHLGLYDMLGNLREWCSDAWSEDLGTENADDPKGAPAMTITTDDGFTCSSRVVKGSGFYDRAWYKYEDGGNVHKSNISAAALAKCRSANREYGRSGWRLNDTRPDIDNTFEGVRLVFSAE